MATAPSESVLWFTRREREVLVLICRAKSHKQIAETLGIRVTGVQYHVGKLLTKLKLADCQDLFKWGLQHPDALRTGITRDVLLHADNCPCEAAYCLTMRGVDLPAAA